MDKVDVENLIQDMKKFGNFLYSLIVGILGLLALLVLISVFPITGNYQIKVVQSGSMEPAIKTGAIVVVVPSENYEVGDVVNFHGGFRGPDGKEITITHRIIEKNLNGQVTVYKTKGDANEEADHEELIDKKIIGKIAFSVPYAGYVIETARKPYGFLAIILVPAGIIIYDRTAAVIKEIKNLKKQKAGFENEEEA